MGIFTSMSLEKHSHICCTSPILQKNATNALTVLFDHWIVKFVIPDILITDNGIEYINEEFAHFCRTYNVQFKSRTPYAPWSNGLVENSNRQSNTFFHNTTKYLLDTQYDTWSQKVKVFPFAFNSQVRTNMTPSPYELYLDKNGNYPLFSTYLPLQIALGNVNLH